MKLKFKRNAKWIYVYVIIGILAALITIILSTLFLPFNKKRLVCQQMQMKPIPGQRFVLYADLNSDGISEKIIMNRITDYQVNPYIKILGADGHLICEKKLKEQWGYNNWMIGDYDNDSLKEFYIITRRRKSYLHDSLFVYGIDPFKRGKNFINRIFITSLDQYFSKTIKDLPWNIRIRIIGFWDADEDGYNDFIFSIFSKEEYEKPKNIFAFSPKKKKIVAKSPDFINEFDFNLIKKKRNEIYIYPRFGSVNQTSDIKNFSFFILNKKLEYELKPFILKSAIDKKMTFYPISNQIEKFIAVQNTSGFKSNFIIFNKNGKILKRFKLNVLNLTNNIFKIDNGSVVDFEKPIFFNRNFSLFLLDSSSNYKPKLFIKTNEPVLGHYYLINLDKDPQRELIAIISKIKSSDKIIYIYDDNLKDFVKLTVPYYSSYKDVILSTKYKKYGSTYLSLSTNKFDALYLYGPNPYYHLNFLIAVAVFLLLFFIFYFIFKQLNRLVFYYHFLGKHLNTVNKGVLLLSFKGTVLHYNKNFIKIFNLTKIKTGQHVRQIFNTYPQILESVNKLLSGEKREVNAEITLQHPDKTFKGRLFGYFLSGMSGIPSGYCLEIYDMSESILSEREEIIARLIRKMAHDIKTPLSTIKFAVEAMHYILPDDAYKKVEEDVSTVVQEVNHIHAITDNYAKFARLSKLNLEIISIKDVINKVINAHGFLETVKVSVNIAPEAEMITADGTQIELLIKEVFENALDAIGRKGEITFESYPVRIGDNEHSDAISLRISDNGVGIAKEIKDRIFEPNFSTKNQGTGFGLVLVKRIVLNHGGQITIDSEEGKGTHVLIILPKDTIKKKE